MYLLILFLFIFGGTSSSTTNTSFLTYDCWELKEKNLMTEIWSSSFADNLRSLTIQNCECVILNISTGEGIKSSLQYLTVRNVKNCEITGNECSGTSLPSHSIFTDLKHMKVKVPLYGESKFSEGILELTNVTIDRLKPGSVTTDTSLKKFSMRRVALMIAARDAISFDGSFNSLLEITDSTFYSVDGNFIVCNVTNVIFQNNQFKIVKGGSFSLGTTTFISLGNFGSTVEDCAIQLYSQQPQGRNGPCGYKENDLFNRKICINLTADNWEEPTSDARDKYIYEESNEIILKSDITNISVENSDNCATATNGTERRENFSIFVKRLGNRFFLLWFLTISLLLLMFPVAYFIKILLCSVINKAFPLDRKHKLLVNEEDV